MRPPEHCGFCGRPAPRLIDGFCSEGCAANERRGYLPATHPDLVLSPPDKQFEARVLCGDAEWLDESAVISRRGEEAVVLIRADSRSELDRAVDDLDGRLITLQRFSGCGPAASDDVLPREETAVENSR